MLLYCVSINRLPTSSVITLVILQILVLLDSAKHSEWLRTIEYGVFASLIYSCILQ